MRIDKFLKNSRIIKRRTVAKDACEISIQFGNGSLTVEVTALLESCRKEDAAKMYRVIE